MRICRRMSEHLIHPLDQPIRNDVFELFGFIVNLGPAHAHDLDQEELNKPVPSQDEHREFLARRRQPCAAIPLVTNEARICQRPHHGRGGSGCHAQGRGDLPHRDKLIRQEGDLMLIDRLQIVFDRA